MNLKSVKIFLSIVISLTVCQYTQSQHFKSIYAEDENYYVDDSTAIDDDTRIAGGHYATLGDFPYIAVVHHLLGGRIIGKCSGTIISSKWVLTAGHCVIEYPQRFLVVFGIIDKSDIVYGSVRGPGVSMLTTHAIIHPNYKEGYNDIALLYLPSIPFSSTIRPIKLAHRRFIANTNALVVGWGKDHMTSKGTKKLKYAVLPIIDNYKCRQFWRINNDHICTVARLEQDACQGDSGGPLIVVENGEAIQIGIVSYGDGFCPSTSPGVFTKVSSYIHWIEEIIKHTRVKRT